MFSIVYGCKVVYTEDMKKARRAGFNSETGNTTTEASPMIDSIMVTPDEKRDAAAVEIARMGHLWHVVTLKVAQGAFPPGTTFYAVPSSTEGASYLTNRVYCSCPDYKRAVCKHIRAVIRFTEQRPARPVRQGYASVMGFCAERGCQEDRVKGDDYCERHQLVDAF